MAPDPSSFDTLPQDQIDRWSRYADPVKVQFVSWLGIEIEELRLDYCRMRLPFRPEFRQAEGIVHGGILATLIDTAAVPALGAGFDGPKQFSTIDLHVQYQGAAGEHDLTAVGWVTRRGRSIAFCRAEVLDPDGLVLAAGSHTFRISGS